MIARRKWLAGAVSGMFTRGLGGAQKPASKSLQQRLDDALSRIEVVDSHEHLQPERERVSRPVDFFTLAGHYAMNDVISAGLPREIANSGTMPAAERWQAFEPHWKNARFTGYGQALRIAIRDIYGFEEISARTLPKINDAIAAQNKPGLYRRILKNRSRIRYAVLDDYWNAAPVRVDPEFYVLARRFDRFITPANRRNLADLEKLTNVSITSLAGLKRAMETSFAQSLQAGMAAVKSTLAYSRDLRFDEVDEETAARSFAGLVRAQALPARGTVRRPFRSLEDHMFHHLMRLADAHHMPVQVHTGLLAGNGAFITNTNPTGLTNVLLRYPQVKFDLFHIAYPYQGELSAMAKMFPNAYVDFCWAHVISPAAARRALHEFLETVPVNKIMGFGGDYRYPELTYAHLQMARHNIARVLAEKAEERFCTEDEALAIGRALLADNPARIFPPPRIE